MSGYFTKLDAGITDSTVWREPDTTRLVWITLLSMADLNGYIGASVPGLADRARVSLDACLQALECFRAPDKWSRSQEFDGRRIADVEGGWVLLNHAKYRALRDAEVRKEQVKQAVARFRAKPKDDVINGNQSNPCKPVKAQADTEAEAEAEALRSKSKDIAVLPTATGPKKSIRKKAKTALPENFGLSDSLKRWAIEKGYDRLDAHLENFLIVVAQHGYVYADWDAALKNAIRCNWAKLEKSVAGRGSSPKVEKTKEQQRSDEIDGLRHMANLGNADAIAKLQQMGIPV